MNVTAETHCSAQIMKQNLKEGQPVRLSVRDFMVFEDDGLLEQMLEINT